MPSTATPSKLQTQRFAVRPLATAGVIILFIVALAIAAPWLVSDWDHIDWLIVTTGAFAAMACAIPGVFLVLRRQSMMGDALSHTVLPGVVAAVIFAEWARRIGWVSDGNFASFQQVVLFVGALFVGILSAVMTEWVQKLGRVESSAALGVVFTTLFAIGLVMIRRTADIHIDMDCVLYGNIENAQVSALIPLIVVFAINLLLVVLFYKELKISAFDSGLATTMGINARVMHYALMAITAATLVIAFERVGSILVIAMLIVPAATSYLLTNRLGPMIAISLLLAAATALLGHLCAIVLPPRIFPPLGFEALAGASASTSGMMAVAAGMLFVVALLFSPRQGVVTRFVVRMRLTLRIAMEDVLGRLYRFEELPGTTAGVATAALLPSDTPGGPWLSKLALHRLVAKGHIAAGETGYALTSAGRVQAQKLVRAHRLWESYMAAHFELPEDHLHDTAERVEHFIDPDIREALAHELQLPAEDPHGKSIPGSGE